jgi:hypothetical protein
MIKTSSLLGLCAVLAVVLAPLACGGGGGGGGGAGADFCSKYATATCQRTFACPDPMNPPPAGFNMSTCVQAFTKLCTDKPDPNAVPIVSCYGATHVNTAAQSDCLSMVAAATCDQINNGTYTYDTVCSMVCSAAPTMGAAGSSGNGGSGGNAGSTGTAGTGPALPTADNFCNQFSLVNCDQAFKCTTPTDRADPSWTLGATVTECKGSVTTMMCNGFAATCPKYNQTFGKACVDAYAAMTCADIAASLTGLPDECGFVCPM